MQPDAIMDTIEAYTDEELIARLKWLATNIIKQHAIADSHTRAQWGIRATSHYIGMRGITPDECRKDARALLVEIARHNTQMVTQS